MDTKIPIVVGVVVALALAGGYIVTCCIPIEKPKKKKSDEESCLENNEQPLMRETRSNSSVDKVAQTEEREEAYPPAIDPIAVDRVASVRGLQNLGNTCYFNSTMQPLVHTNLTFRVELENLHKKGDFVKSVLTFLGDMHHENRKPYSPDKMHRMFGKKSPKFADYRQHDSHECLRNFLDNVRKEERDSSGAVDKRKVLTVVDKVFGGHFVTVYNCLECGTPYHVCEALLDISLPIMINEKDLAAMNSARGGQGMKSRTVKLQTPKGRVKEGSSQTDKTNKRKYTKQSIDSLRQSRADESIYKETTIAVDGKIDLKPSETDPDSGVDATLQQNTSDQATQLQPEADNTNSSAQGLEPESSEIRVHSALDEPEALSRQEETTGLVEADELLLLNDVGRNSPNIVELESTSGADSREMMSKEDCLTNLNVLNTDTESKTMASSLDDEDKSAEESMTTFVTETDMGEVCMEEGSDTSEVSTRKETVFGEEEESLENVSSANTLEANVENISSSSTEAEITNLEEKNDAACDRNPPQGPSIIEPRIPIGPEDSRASEVDELMKNDEQDNSIETQECNEGLGRPSEEEQLKQQEEQQHDEQHSKHTELVEERRNAVENEGGQDLNKAEPHSINHDMTEIEAGQQIHDTEQDQEQRGIQEEHERHFTNSELLEEKIAEVMELCEGKPLLNVQPEKKDNGTEEQNTGQNIRNIELEREPREDEKQDAETERQTKVNEYKEADEKEDKDLKAQELEKEDTEEALLTDDKKDSNDENKDKKDRKDRDEEIDVIEEGYVWEEEEIQKRQIDTAQEKDVDEDVKEETDDEGEEKDEKEEGKKKGQELVKEDTEETLRSDDINDGDEEKIDEEDKKDKDEEIKDIAEGDVEEGQEFQERNRDPAQEKDDEKAVKEEMEDEEEEKDEEEEEEEEGEEEEEEEGEEEEEEEEADQRDDEEDVGEQAEEEEELEEKDNEVQILHQTQEAGEIEFEVEASEIGDSYREAVDKLMTPLSLTTPYLTREKKCVTIYDCLTYLTRKEHIYKEYLCNDCYGKHLANGGKDIYLTSATKQTVIYNPPAVLTLHLKRFELKPGGSLKRSDMITYGEHLDIAPFCSSMCLRNDPPCSNIWYSLYGVVVHHGSTLTSGHYTAFVKIWDEDAGFKKFFQEKYFDRDFTKDQLIEMMQEKQPRESRSRKQPDGTWYCMNDSSFHEVNVEEVLDQEAYLLFYERMP